MVRPLGHGSLLRHRKVRFASSSPGPHEDGPSPERMGAGWPEGWLTCPGTGGPHHVESVAHFRRNEWASSRGSGLGATPPHGDWEGPASPYCQRENVGLGRGGSNGTGANPGSGKIEWNRGEPWFGEDWVGEWGFGIRA